jgi:hypothetical protein
VHEYLEVPVSLLVEFAAAQLHPGALSVVRASSRAGSPTSASVEEDPLQGVSGASEGRVLARPLRSPPLGCQGVEAS